MVLIQILMELMGVGIHRFIAEGLLMSMITVDASNLQMNCPDLCGSLRKLKNCTTKLSVKREFLFEEYQICGSLYTLNIWPVCFRQ